MREIGERLRIRVALAGLTFKEAGELLDLSPDRAAELIGDRGAFHELHELRCELRAKLNMGPDLRAVYRTLIIGRLTPATAGRDIRWVRTILGVSLQTWVHRHGHSTWWWSKFETEEGRAGTLLLDGALGERERFSLEVELLDAASKLVRLFPWAVEGGHFDASDHRPAG